MSTPNHTASQIRPTDSNLSRIAVCVTTYKRPAGLKRLLDGLSHLTFSTPPPDITVVVVDNDEHQSAKPVVDKLSTDYRWPLVYQPEPQRGITYGRNKALQIAKPLSDAIAFIDDDESPEPQWLDRLIQTQQRTNADAVTGPVVPEFDQPPPDWIVKGQFFDAPKRRTGTIIPYAYTGNVLFKTNLLHADPTLEFDHRCALMGGEDRHFFQKLHRAGRKIVWCDNAIVREWNPPQRATPSWLIRRMYRTGNAATFVELDLRARPWVVEAAPILAKGAFWFLCGALLTLVGCVLGKNVFVRGRQFTMFGIGRWAGLFGLRYEEYRETVGD
jgi:glycosyltransferase involved in cell wall biosynthesis